MSTLKLFPVWLIVASVVAGIGVASFSTNVSADMGDACNNSSYTAAQKTACEDGYKNTKQCQSLSGEAQDACNKGRQQAVTDGVAPGTGSGDQKEGSGKCGGAKTELIACKEDAGLGAIASIITMAIMIVTAIIGVVAVGGLTYAAILYASAGDNQGQVQQAIGIIRNVVIGIVMYGLSIGIINWLIPGGVIG